MFIDLIVNFIEIKRSGFCAWLKAGVVVCLVVCLVGCLLGAIGNVTSSFTGKSGFFAYLLVSCALIDIMLLKEANEKARAKILKLEEANKAANSELNEANKAANSKLDEANKAANSKLEEANKAANSKLKEAIEAANSKLKEANEAAKAEISANKHIVWQKDQELVEEKSLNSTKNHLIRIQDQEIKNLELRIVKNHEKIIKQKMHNKVLLNYNFLLLQVFDNMKEGFIKQRKECHENQNRGLGEFYKKETEKNEQDLYLKELCEKSIKICQIYQKQDIKKLEESFEQTGKAVNQNCQEISNNNFGSSFVLNVKETTELTI